VWLEPVDVRERMDDKMFGCPMYKTSIRAGELLTTGHSTNFVCNIYVPSEFNEEYWIRRGAALLCMTDD
jgi:dynein heavy chain